MIIPEFDYVYDPNYWEFTIPWSDIYLLVDDAPIYEVLELSTLIRGPNIFVVGSQDGTQWFRTREEADDYAKKIKAAMDEET